jgi:hypothetical protein
MKVIDQAIARSGSSLKKLICDIAGFLLIAVLWLPTGLLMLIASLFVCAIFGTHITQFGSDLIKNGVANTATAADLYGDLPLVILLFTVGSFCTWASVRLVSSGLRYIAKYYELYFGKTNKLPSHVEK